MSKNSLIVFQKKFLETIKSKAFIIATITVPLLVVIVMGVVGFITYKSMKKEKIFYYIDKTGNFVQKMKKKVPKNVKLKKWDKTKDEGIEQIKKKKIENLLFVDNDIYETYEIEYMGRSVSDQQRLNILKSVATDIIHNKKLDEKGINKKEISFLLKKASINTFKVTKKEGKKKESASTNYWVAYVLLYTLIIVIMINAPKLVQ